MKLAGILLIIVGVICLSFQFINFTETKHDATIGPIDINHQETHSIPLPPIIGGACIAGGVLALVLGARGARM